MVQRVAQHGDKLATRYQLLQSLAVVAHVSAAQNVIGRLDVAQRLHRVVDDAGGDLGGGVGG